MHIMEPKKKTAVSTDTLGSLEKTAANNQDLPEILDDSEEGQEMDVDDADLANLDEFPEDPYEETEEAEGTGDTEESDRA